MLVAVKADMSRAEFPVRTPRKRLLVKATKPGDKVSLGEKAAEFVKGVKLISIHLPLKPEGEELPV